MDEALWTFLSEHPGYAATVGYWKEENVWCVVLSTANHASGVVFRACSESRTDAIRQALKQTGWLE